MLRPPEGRPPLVGIASTGGGDEVLLVALFGSGDAATLDDNPFAQPSLDGLG